MTATKLMTADLREAFLAQFEAREKQASAELPALRRLRKAAISRFAELGFPGARNEEWRFTPLAALLRIRFTLADPRPVCTGDQIRKLNFRLPECATLVIVNGRFRPELSTQKALPEGVFAGSLAQAIEMHPGLVEGHLGRIARFEHQPFTALNSAFFCDGAFVHLPAAVVVPTTIQLLHVSLPGADASVSWPRTLILAEAGSQATVLETYVSPAEGATFANAVTEINVGERAVLDHYKLQRESLTAFHIAAMHVRLGRAASFKNHSFALGGALVRNDFTATLEGEGAECTLNGLTLVDGQQLIDNHTNIEHAVPNCPSHELYKNIIRGHGKVVFNGKIIVRQDAQKTDARQTNKTLLLSPDGTINTKPQLEIFADDVKCTHGATVGQLDDEALFYLRSRGIDLEQARSLLTYAFANDIVERIQIQSLRQALEALVLQREHLTPAQPGGKEAP